MGIEHAHHRLMALELDADQIPSLLLVPVSTNPDRLDARTDGPVVLGQAMQTSIEEFLP